MKKTNFIAALALLLGLGAAAYGDGKGSADFIRYATEGDTGLQIAVTDFVSSNSKTTVTLYGVVHVADVDYYKLVQTDLDKYDAVLYEGVKAGVNPNPETKILNAMQHLMGDVLDLKFQKDGIDYTRKNLVHADINMDDLQKSMKGESITPFGGYIKTEQLEYLKPFLDIGSKLLKEYMKSDPALQNRLKAQLAQQLGSVDINTQLSPDMHKAIVLDRNAIVIDVLKDQLQKFPEKHSYSIFYGAAHMPDMQERLQKLGYKESSKRWMTAWKVKPIADAPEEGDNGEDK